VSELEFALWWDNWELDLIVLIQIQIALSVPPMGLFSYVQTLAHCLCIAWHPKSSADKSFKANKTYFFTLEDLEVSLPPTWKVLSHSQRQAWSLASSYKLPISLRRQECKLPISLGTVECNLAISPGRMECNGASRESWHTDKACLNSQGLGYE